LGGEEPEATEGEELEAREGEELEAREGEELEARRGRSWRQGRQRISTTEQRSQRRKRIFRSAGSEFDAAPARRAGWREGKARPRRIGKPLAERIRFLR
jgi:hypothetical protein